MITCSGPSTLKPLGFAFFVAALAAPLWDAFAARGRPDAARGSRSPRRTGGTGLLPRSASGGAASPHFFHVGTDAGDEALRLGVPGPLIPSHPSLGHK